MTTDFVFDFDFAVSEDMGDTVMGDPELHHIQFFKIEFSPSTFMMLWTQFSSIITEELLIQHTLEVHCTAAACCETLTSGLFI